MANQVFRYALGVDYVGTNFHGWQRQGTDLLTVQAVLEDALLDVMAEPVRLVCAGRTDKGVHAVGQVVHFDGHAQRPEHAFTRGVNSLLPAAVRVRWARLVPADFHARFSARARRYCYAICNDPIESALTSWGMAWWREVLDVDAMHNAAQAWLGEHDFSAFRASACHSKTPMRHIEAIRVVRMNTCIMLDVTANAFLLHMVRNIAGSLRLIGNGARPIQWAGELLAAKDRTQAGVTAEPRGLYLVSARYPSRFNLPHVTAPEWSPLAAFS